MALKNMTYSLYSKIALWLVLNLVLLAVLGFGIGWYVLLGNGLVPAHFFSSNIENSFRLVSVNLQYRSVFTWQKLLKQYDRGEALRFHLRTLETGVLYDDCIPEKVIQAAMAIPKSSFTLCPDPDMQLWDSLRGGFFDTQQRNMEAGCPSARHLCAHAFPGAVLVRPRAVHPGQEPSAPLRASGAGDGFLLRLRAVFRIPGRPLGDPRRARGVLPVVVALRAPPFPALVENGSLCRTGGDGQFRLPRQGAERHQDVLRRTAGRDRAARTCVHDHDAAGGLLISGQSQFIRHIAHELNSPLARTQIGLAILEERLEGNPKARVQRIMQDINRLSVLTDEVLSYLQAKASLGTPKNERIYLCPFLSSIVRSEAPEADVNVFADKDAWLWTDKDYLRRAVCNVLRNAIIYAGEAVPIVVEVGEEHGEVRISVLDRGRACPNRICPCCWSPSTGARRP
ncbi:MAG: sensor histidine kinase [Bilophila wadsworthia]